MKQFILTVFACFTVFFAEAQVNKPVTGQPESTGKSPLIEKKEKEKEVSIYPNPTTTGMFTISVPNLHEKKVDLRIMNVIGNEIYHETVSRVDGNFARTIDLNQYAKGLYYVKLETDDFSTVRRVVIK